MKTYFNELAPWEEKKQYHKIIELGKSVSNQTVAMKKASDNQISSLLASASSIVSSQERTSELISSGFSELSYSLDNISNGINNLGAIFEWGISEVIWQIEQNTEVLRSILRTLESPKETEANERKRWGDNAYASGLLDDALEDYLVAEKMYKYDFTIYISIGMIYLKYVKDKAKALEYYDKAIKYARPKSNHYTSFALLCRGVTLFDMGKINEAEKSSRDAIDISPNFLEAYYQNSQYNAQLGNIEKSISNLTFTINEDIRYVLKFDQDKLFDPIRLKMNELLIKKKEEIYSSSNKNYTTLLLYIDKLNKIFSEYNDVSTLGYQKETFKKEERRFAQLIERDSFLDAIETRKFISDFESLILEQFKNFSKEILSVIKSLECQIKNEKTKIGKQIKSSEKKSTSVGMWIFVISIIIGIIFGFKGCFEQFESHNADLALWYFIRNVGIVQIIGIVIYFLCFFLTEPKSEKSQIENSEEIKALKSKINKLNRVKWLLQNLSITNISFSNDVTHSLSFEESIYYCSNCNGEMELTTDEMVDKRFICADCGVLNKI
jgi:tetratricopeptide (TPR) repeat protein